MNPGGGAVPQTFETASPDGKNRPRSQLPEKLAAVVPPKMGEKTHSAQSGCIFQNFIADLGSCIEVDKVNTFVKSTVSGPQRSSIFMARNERG
jgi:hypothetical protein